MRSTDAVTPGPEAAPATRPVGVVALVLRGWAAFAALGVGIIHLALVMRAPIPLAILLVVLGAAELTWAVVVLRSGRLPRPRLAIAAALLPLAVWAGMLAAFAGTPAAQLLSPRALAGAGLLELFVALIVAAALRGGRADAEPSAEPPVVRYLSGLFVGALLIGALTIPSVAVAQQAPGAPPVVPAHEHG